MANLRPTDEYRLVNRQGVMVLQRMFEQVTDDQYDHDQPVWKDVPTIVE